MSSTTNANIVQRLELLEKQVALLLKADAPVEAGPVTKDKPVKKAKVVKNDVSSDEEKPKKKRTSGYLLYSADMREAVKTKLSADGAKLKNQDIMTELGAMWKALSDEEKASWNEKAKVVEVDADVDVSE
jgi:hypothetical protein